MAGTRGNLLMTADTVGGIWTYAVELGRAMAARGWHVTLAVVGPPVDDARRRAAVGMGLDLVHVDATPDWLASGPGEVTRGAEAVAALGRRMGASLVHLNHPAFAATVAFDAPVVAVCHSCVATWWAAVKGTPLPELFRWQAVMVGQGYRAAQALVAPSRSFAEATGLAYTLPTRPVIVLNGRRAPSPEEPDGPPSPAALTAGRLWDEGKDIATLDRATALTAVPVRAAGPVQGPNGATIALAHLDRLGELPEADLHALLAARPIYVSTARYEPFGLAVLEAAQAGCALVLSDIDTFRELWDDAAVFVPPGDAAGFAAALDRLIAEPATRARLAAAAVDRAADYALESHTAGMDAVYATLLNGMPPAGARAA